MTLVWTHFRFLSLETLRQPMATVSTMVFPGLFYVLFVIPNVADDRVAANITLGSFLAFATLLVVLFQFGVGVAEERERPWQPYLRTLPVRPAQVLASWVGVAMLFAMLGSIPLLVLAVTQTPVSVPPVRWLPTALAVLGGAVPLALFGLAVGYRLPVKAALPTINIAFFPLAFGGGLFLPPDILPGVLQSVSPYLPTRNYGELVWAAMLGGGVPWAHLGGLLAWTAAFGGLALLAYRRDEGRRYR